MKTRKEYDRKYDEDVPVGAIEKAVESKEVSVDEIVAVFRAALVEEGGLK